MKIYLPSFGERNLYKFNVKSSNFTWFGTGGTLDVLFKPENLEDLIFFLKNFENKELINVIGASSNLIIRDGGVRGVSIRLGRGFNFINKISDFNKNEIEVGSSTLDYNISNYCLDNVIGGMEFLSGIPGSLGGNLRMNAGCYGGDMSKVVKSINAVDKNGQIVKYDNLSGLFSYRQVDLPDDIIFTSAVLYGYDDEYDNIRKKMDDIKKSREESQPLRTKTGGSTFANHKDMSAWKVIDNCGYRGVKLGGAMVSEKHCNFLINFDGATSSDIEDLGENIRSEALDKFDIDLKWEIRRIGDRDQIKKIEYIIK